MHNRLKNRYSIFNFLLLSVLLTLATPFASAQDFNITTGDDAADIDPTLSTSFERNWTPDVTQVATGRIVVKLTETTSPSVLNSITNGTLQAVRGLPQTYVLTPGSVTMSPTDQAALDGLVQRLATTAGVIYAEPEYRVFNERGMPPTDPLYGDQFFLENASGHDIQAETAWNAGYTGAGVTVGINDDGYQTTHPDLDAPKYVANRSYDYGDGDTDPNPFLGAGTCTTGSPVDDCHGTSVAGVVGAEANNAVCGAGVAYNANLTGLRLNFDTGWTTTTEAQMYLNALAADPTPLDVINHSWGPGGTSVGTLTAVQADALQQSATGNNTIHVFAAGNGHSLLAHTGRNGNVLSRYTIAVGATTNAGVKSSYSEEGGAVLVNAPSSGGSAGVTTTDLLGADGYGGYPSNLECTNNFGGTSSAAPTVAGVVALMLEANPNLTWRDVQHILVQTSQQNDPGDASWQVNGAGYPTSHKYGFGTVDAGAATAAAATWPGVGAYVNEVFGAWLINLAIPDGISLGVYGAAVSDSQNLTSFIDELEHVELTVTATHTFQGDLRFRLVSPSGTESELMDLTNASNLGYSTGRTFMSTQFWGEDPDGTWTILVDDGVNTDTGNFNTWLLTFYGTTSTPCASYSFPYTVGAGNTPDLLQAIQCANTNPGADVINLTGSTYTLTDTTVTGAGGPFSNGNGDNGLPIITDTLTLNGNGATLIRDSAAANFRILQVDNSSTLTMDNLSLSRGQIAANGGGILVQSASTLYLLNSILSGNDAGSNAGGGLMNNGTATIINSIISGNSANTGAGISTGDTLVVTNSTLAGNAANLNGGGIESFGGTTLVQNSIVHSNTAASGASMHQSAGTFTVRDSLYEGSGLSGTIDTSDPGNLPTGNPDFVNLVAATFGSPTTVGDYDINPTSDAVDVGDNTADPDDAGSLYSNMSVDFATDIDGDSRIVSGTIDMGAHERFIPVCFTEYTGDNVTDFSSADHTAVQDAVNASASGGTVKIAGTCAGVSNQDANGDNETVLITQNITLQGGYDAANWLAPSDPVTYPTILDATNSGRVVDNSAAFTVTLDGLTLQNGSEILGGGIVNNGPMTLTNSIVTNNYATEAGGIFNNGTLLVSNSTISNNAGGTNVGGIWNQNTLTIVNSTISGNIANQHGGIVNAAGTLTMLNSTVSGNSTIVSAGVGIGGGTATISNSTISNNTATDVAGGLVVFGTVTVNVTNSTIANNSSITGGNVYHQSGTVTLRNTIVDNALAGGNCFGTITDGGHNISSDASCGFTDPDSLNSTNPLLDPLGLQNNGGPTQTIALQTGSPATDTGDNTFLDEATFTLDYNGDGDTLDTLSTDQRDSGFARIGGGTVDIGAYETLVCFTEYTGDNVTDFSSVDHTAVQDAINAASAGATVKIAGTCAGVSNQDANAISETVLITKNITLQGGYINANWLVPSDPVTYPTVLDATNGGRVVDNSGGHTLTVAGLTLQNATLTDDGGGIFNSGTLTVDNSIFTNNATSGTLNDGPGIFNSGTATVSNSTFSNNTSTNANGGGIRNIGTLTVTNSIFSNNTVGGFGGGIANGGPATIINTTFSGNNGGTGGGIYTNNALTVLNSTFDGNAATSSGGGGLYIAGNTTIMTNTTITGNSATVSLGGGGLYSGGTTTITNSTIAGNTSPAGSSNVRQNGGTLTLRNTILDNPLIGDNCTGTITDGGHNISSDNSCGFSATGSVNNVNPMLDPLGLQNNGGPTQTIALQFGSPAINAGNNSFLLESTFSLDYNGDGDTLDTISTDQRDTGFPRIVNGTVDMGAYEPPPPVCFTEYTGDNVTDFGSADHTAVQQAINAASAGATVKIAGTCAGVSNQDANSDNETVLITKNITLEGGYDASNWLATSDPVTYPTILDATNSGRVVDNDGVHTVTIDGLTLQNGNESFGGGLLNAGTLTLTNSILTANIATSSGGVGNTGILTITDSTISDNTAEDGGGVGNGGGGTLTISNSTISANMALDDGGGIINTGTLTISNSTVSGNTGNGDGGGIVTEGAITIIDSTISGNMAGTVAGIYQPTGTMTILNSTISGNTGNTVGGVVTNVTATITNSTISGNIANNTGGGVVPIGGTLVITNSTISGNSDPVASNINVLGGGITLRNTIVDNPVGGGNNCTGTITDGGHNISSDASCAFTDPDSLNSTTPMLDPLGLQNNGGPTQTIALQAGSPAIDMGDDTFLDEATFTLDYNGDGDTLDTISTDQRDTGFPRILGGTVDMGAYEFHPPVCFTEYTGDNVTDFSSVDHTAVQDAVNAATAGGTVKIAGTCAGVSDTDADTEFETVFVDKNITLQGGYDAVTQDWSITPDGAMYPTTLDADASGRVIDMVGSLTVNINDLRIVNGNVGGAITAAGIYADSSTLTLTDSLLQDHVGPAAGTAIYTTGALTLTDTTVWQNTGAFTIIYVDSGTDVDFNGATIAYNTASETVTIRDVPQINIVDTVISSNDGAGLIVSDGGDLTISGGQFNFNQGDAIGYFESFAGTFNILIDGATISNNSLFGAIDFNGTNSVALIRNSAIHDNANTLDFGSGLQTQGIDVTLVNNTIANNTSDGGAVYANSSAVVTSINNTFSNNTGNTQAAHIYTATGGSVVLYNTILNAAQGGNGSCGGTITDGGHNISSDASCAFTDPDSLNSTNPLLDAAGLQNNGGPTQTIALLAGSPAINAGNNSFLLESTFSLDYNGDGDTLDTISTDQRDTGFPRIVNGTVDMGAYEAPLPLINIITDVTTGGATNDGTINAGEYVGSTMGTGAGFGDVIGTNSTLYIDSDTSGNLFFGLSSGGGSFNDYIVIYIDSVVGGMTDTTTLEDRADSHRSAISGDGFTSGQSEITFGVGFVPDYAIVFDESVFAGMWQLTPGGNNSLTFVSSLTLTPTGNPSAGAWELSGIDMSDIGLIAGDSFKYIATYLNEDNAFRSNELQGITTNPSPSVNIGANPVTLPNTEYNLFHSISGSVACFAEYTGDNVTDFSSVDHTAVQNAINAAPASGTVKIAGTCAGTSANVLFGNEVAEIDKDLTLEGGYDPTNWLAASDPATYPTVLDAVTSGRVVLVAIGHVVVLDGLTLQNGLTGTAGTDNGAGIYNLGNLTVRNSIITNNTSGNFGGGIYNNIGNMTVIDSVISNNTGLSGGGLSTNTTATIINTTVSGNQTTSAGAGGGLHSSGGGNFTLLNSTITGNMTNNFGGGVAMFGGNHTITNNTITGNTAVNGGGGVLNTGTLTITNSTITGNSNPSGGSNLAILSGGITLRNTLVSNPLGGGANCNGTITDGGHNISSDASCAFTDPDSLNSTDPLLDPLGLQNNGGPTQTIATQFGSPTWDAGDDSFLDEATFTLDYNGDGDTVDVINTDQRGLNRFVLTTDIGAYETGSDRCYAEIDGDNITDFSSLDHTALPSAVSAAPAGGTVKVAGICAGVTGSELINLSKNIVLQGGYDPNAINWLATPDPTTHRAVLDAVNSGRVIFNLSGFDLTMDGFIVQHGNAASGAGVFIRGTTSISNSILRNNAGGNGGAIYTDDTLVLTNNTFDSNTAASGGGLSNNGGAVTIINNTFVGNSASNIGGAYYSVGNNNDTITNSTFVGNSATNSGGAIEEASVAILVISHSTFSGNSSPQGATIRAGANPVFLRNTLLDDPLGGGDNCFGTITDARYNISSDASCSFSNTGSLNSTNPLLDAAGLQDNGGVTQTILLQALSPALNIVPPWVCGYDHDNNLPTPNHTLYFDQRGEPRQQGRNCDSGAVEMPQATILFNELDVDQSATINGDDAEFIEFYDGGYGSTPFVDYVIVFSDGSSGWYGSLPVSATTLATDANGYFVVCINLLNTSPYCDFNMQRPNDWLRDGTHVVSMHLSTTTGPFTYTYTLPEGADGFAYDTDSTVNPLAGTYIPGPFGQVSENGDAGSVLDSIQRCSSTTTPTPYDDTVANNAPTPGMVNNCVFPFTPNPQPQPEAPALLNEVQAIGPTDKARAGEQVTFTWAATPDADVYHIWLMKADPQYVADWQLDAATVCDNGTCRATLPDGVTLEDGHYIWMVRSYNDDMTQASNWSADALFIVGDITADVDGDGTVTPLDVMRVINRVNTDDLSADVDGNGLVNEADVEAALAQLGQTR